jgi:hypothetical protein
MKIGKAEIFATLGHWIPIIQYGFGEIFDNFVRSGSNDPWLLLVLARSRFLAKAQKLSYSSFIEEAAI